LWGAWAELFRTETRKPYFRDLVAFVRSERKQFQVYPPSHKVFNAYKATHLEDVRVVILGQDPYHKLGQAHGLCFSVPHGYVPPPSLQNIYVELERDVDVSRLKGGSLWGWARQGVLLLNSVLTVRDSEPGSHRDHGWETFTDATLQAVNALDRPVVFVLWGRYAQAKRRFVDESTHTVIASSHPSPLSASNGFFGSRPFSRINAALAQHQTKLIDWAL
jgi:uracil-DNA glycosylase